MQKMRDCHDTAGAISRLLRRALPALCLISMLISGFAAYQCPPYLDEGTFSSAAYNLSHHGFMGTTALETAGTGLTRIETHTYWVMPLYILGEAAWMLLAPSSLFSVRLFSALWIPVTVYALLFFLRGLSVPEPIPELAACIFTLDFVLMDVAKNARPDILCQALGWCGLAVFVALRKSSLSQALFWSNALIALSGLCHPNGILYLMALVLLVLMLDRQRLSLREAVISLAVYLCAAAIWSAYIFQDPQAFVQQLSANNDHRFGNTGWSGNSGLPLAVSIVWNEIHDRYLALFGLLSPFPQSRLKGLVLLTFAASLAVTAGVPALRKSFENRILLGIWAIMFGIQSIFNQKLGMYLIHIEPVYCALTAVAAWFVWQRFPKLRAALFAWLALVAAIQVGFMVGKSVTLSNAEPRRDVAHFLEQHARRARLIMGSACLIHSVNYDPRYLDDRYLGIRSGKRADVIVTADHLDADLYASMRRAQPQDWEHIRQRLSEYRLVYECPDYRVYFDTGFSGDP